MVENLHESHVLQMLDKTEYIALGVGKRIEPSPPLMNNDDDFVTATEFDRLAGTLLQVDHKARLLQYSGARDTDPQVFQFLFLHSFAGALASAFLSGFFFPQFAGPFPAAREEQRGQGRGRQGADLHRAAAQLPLPPAARKRHPKEEKGRFNDPAHIRRDQIRR